MPINVTLLFSCEHYLAAADAYLRGIERRVAAGLNPRVESVASVFISRWDGAVADKVPVDLRNKLGIAIGERTYAAYCDLLASDRGAGSPTTAPTCSVCCGPAPAPNMTPRRPTIFMSGRWPRRSTVNTMPEPTLLSFADHGTLGPISPEGGAAEELLRKIAQIGIDVDALAAQLQEAGAAAFVKSWDELLIVLDAKANAPLAG